MPCYVGLQMNQFAKRRKSISLMVDITYNVCWCIVKTDLELYKYPIFEIEYCQDSLIGSHAPSETSISL